MANNRGPAVRAEGLVRRIAAPEGEIRLLEGVDLSIAPGEAVAVLGPSGSGKSTLLALLAGLDLPDAGRVWLEGTELTALDEEGRAAARAGRVGFVFQQFHLLPHLTALENVMLPLELAGRRDARRRARELLEAVGLGARLRHLPRQLSGGEQQRVALARAFAISPRILFADEPTGSLDRATGERVAGQLQRLREEAGTAMVLVTHDEGLAARCDRRLLLEGGRLRPLP